MTHASRISRILAAAALLGAAAPLAAQAAPNELDTFVLAQMAQRRIPGLSLAILRNGKIDARAYGVTDLGGTQRVTTTTLFQAGSISKSVAALGALHLVEQQKLNLDTPVNASLTTWKLPPSEFTATRPVTLRGLLSHTAGLTVHGFPGYDVSAPMPTLVQVLDGTAPANTDAIRSDAVPGARWNYSGGGYTIMQQMMIDVTHQSFPDFMQRAVLAPLGMSNSSYAQPLPAAMASATAAGHYPGGRLVKGRWHLYPEMAAAGLWTTPTDLLRFATEIQQSNAGKSNTVISQSMTREMLTEQKDMDGLGVFLEDSGSALRFGHNGRDDGFDALLTATVVGGHGAAIMINANDNSAMAPRIRSFIARMNHWPNSTPYVRPAAVTVAAAELDAAVGRYEMSNNNMVAFVVDQGRLFRSSDGLPDEEFVPLGDNTFASLDRPAQMTLARDATGTVTGFAWTTRGVTRTVPRVGPLFSNLVSTPDANPILTARAESVVRALGKGGDAVASVAGITDAARRDFGHRAWPPAGDVRRLSYITEENVAARNMERHDGRVARIRYYRMTTGEGELNLMVHFTSEGLVTDVDVVDE